MTQPSDARDSRVALITGAAGEIAGAVAALLADHDWALILPDVHDEAGRALATELTGQGARADYRRLAVGTKPERTPVRRMTVHE